jgi:hypothetical protein
MSSHEVILQTTYLTVFSQDSAATDFPLQIKYRQAAENEMTYLYVPGIL